MDTLTLTLRLIPLFIQWNTNQVFGRIERRQNIKCVASFAMLTVYTEVSDITTINYHKPLVWHLISIHVYPASTT